MISSDLMKQRRFRIWIAICLFLAYIALYAYFYRTIPFPENLNELVTNGMVALAAGIAAMMSMLVWSRYGKSTPPRGVWFNFMVALWGWTIAEVIWMCEYAIGGEKLAEFSIADVFWVVSYIFFLSALTRQFLLIYRPRKIISMAYLALSILAVLTFTYLFALWLADLNNVALDLKTLVYAFYPIGDFALSLGAFFLIFAFRDGALGRPWLGLLIFAFSDLMYTWLETSGLYAWSLAEGNLLLTAITNFTYLAAYLSIAFGCYLQWLLLFYGPRLKYDQST
jgi:hypothetical protein